MTVETKLSNPSTMNISIKTQVITLLPALLLVAIPLVEGQAAAPSIQRLSIYSRGQRVTMLSLNKNQKAKLRAKAYDIRGRLIPKIRVTWTSSKKSVAKISSNGTVQCLVPGTSTISATYRKIKSRLRLTCTNKMIRGTAIAASMNHAAILGENGDVWSAAMLFTSGIDTPVIRKVSGLSNIQAIDCAPAHCYALNKEGLLYMFGLNWTTMEPYPAEQMPGIGPVKFFAVGGYSHADEFGIAQDIAGQIINWGDNSFNQFGDGTTNPAPVPRENGAMGSDLLALSAGDAQGLSIVSTGACHYWGRMSNQSGNQFPLEQTLSIDRNVSVTRVSAGGSYNLALLNDGYVWAFGHMIAGQVSDIRYPTAFTAGAELYFPMLFVKSDGTVWSLSPNVSDGSLPAPELYADVNDVELLDAFNHAYFLRSDGALLIQVSTHTVPYITENPLR